MILARWATAPLGAADCEPLRDGLLAQPLNTGSSLAFVIAGAGVLAAAELARAPDTPRRARVGAAADRSRASFAPRYPRAYAAALAMTGVGSVLYHGPGWPGSQWIHDAALALPSLALLAAGIGTPRGDRAVLATAAAAGTVVAVRPATGLTVAGAAALAAVLVWLRRRGSLGAPARNGLRWAALAGAAALPFQLWGRTGGPLCTGSMPAHAVWHVLAAAALGALGALVVRGPVHG